MEKDNRSEKSRLTLYVLPSDDLERKHMDRLIDSFEEAGILAKVVIMTNLSFASINEIESPWYCLMYDTEYLSPALIKALPVMLEDAEFDYFSFHKKQMYSARGKYVPEQEETDIAKAKFLVAPRVFRKDVKLKSDSIEPVDPNLKGTGILDGWVFDIMRPEPSDTDKTE